MLMPARGSRWTVGDVLLLLAGLALATLAAGYLVGRCWVNIGD